MGYNTLTVVNFRHVFFVDKIFDRIAVKVPSQTVTDMRRYGLLIRQIPGGFVLLYDVDVYDKQDKLTLLFDLELKDPLFYTYTLLQQVNIQKSILLFNNNPRNKAGTLHQEDYVSGKEVYTLKPADRYFIKPFGRIVLKLGTTFESRYDIRFDANALRWRYFLMSDHLASLSEPVITDTTGKVQFSRQDHVFTSDIPITLMPRNQYSFQLLDGDKVVISTLPMPDISRISAFVPDNELFSEIFLY
jgi:hypothetical protein